MKQTRKITLIVAALLCAMPLAAHESWIDTVPSSKQGFTEVRICNGHHFPRSDHDINPRIISAFYAITPSGKKVQLELRKTGTYVTAELDTREQGVYILVATLKRPPRYFLRAIMVKGSTSSPAALGSGEELEIVPSMPPSAAGNGGSLTLTVKHRGKPVEADITVSVDGKSNTSSYTNSRGEYSLKLRAGARYLIGASFQGKEATLVFTIP